ncbi:TetR/AcrR family transcriptional regulator [Paenarthrobacter sp. Z7-10]|uniref:SACE_7040 family transcriptional regulator n=1 Tax=Paenarthrobacter sp. Z7-10 TaxID=2787635 RepID=UPI0022A9B6C8|nr:TetR/AcrR family transcriptional regulator [Paenarthrobacter sp. Z7-10]MCZ2402497.1 TetR/AcrR family transcriptional regulator [Paenarthrobacter sp. Z7-10]
MAGPAENPQNSVSPDGREKSGIRGPAPAAVASPDAADVPEPIPPSLRSQAKANRRQAMLNAAARLFAQHGYNRVSIEELGAAAGVSGPAVYRHFSGKQAVLAALLVGVSEDLNTGGSAVVAQAVGDDAALRGLIRFHVDFALSNPDVIRVQDRDLGNLAEADQKSVRTLQRHYIDQWVAVLGRLQPGCTGATLRLKVQATFGLINSTPHSARSPGRNVDARAARPVLEAMARAGLLA